MGIANRDLDSSEQLYVLQGQDNTSAAGTDVTLMTCVVPTQGVLLQTMIAATGLSAVPVYHVEIQRWTSTGVTVFNPGGNITLAVGYGVSGGVVGETYAASSTLSNVYVGDVLALQSAVADAAAGQLIVNYVIRATQDFKKTQSI